MEAMKAAVDVIAREPIAVGVLSRPQTDDVSASVALQTNYKPTPL
jgi:hypothetical protein